MSYKDPKKGLICGVSVLLLGLSPVFFAIKIGFYGGFRGKRIDDAEKLSEEDIPTDTEIYD